MTAVLGKVCTKDSRHPHVPFRDSAAFGQEGEFYDLRHVYKRLKAKKKCVDSQRCPEISLAVWL